MNSSLIQLLILAGIAIFLILKLKSVLGTRDGFEKPPVPLEELRPRVKRDFEVIEGGVDPDIADHAEEGSDTAKALMGMKKAEPSFSVNTFLQGARGAYEMILMAFERGNIDEIRPFLEDEIEAAFTQAINAREEKGLTIESKFIGLKELSLQSATFDPTTKRAEVSIRYVAELTSAVRDKAGEIIEGNPKEIKRQRDIWTFGRTMGAADPNWQLVATGD
ncbi:MAG: Tim44/TimA family putative adaptor protein [Rhodobacteraceae bacterium]|nr:Tim44/TimA family putative adaptor protein [Paracoccaceae bacterium]MCF8516028.1 Tim44/TimA family putative adaptor protein [Paracoccaceae bacterium]MCF8520367.1 Tim44/TimA family putative adaptor protein [Paracoccaceae bacterium]